MPKHIRNGKIVGGAIGIARNLFFDKTKKNLLAAENVQDAVDELSEKSNNYLNLVDVEKVSSAIDFNEYLEAGTQIIVPKNAVAVNCENIPEPVAGTLIVVDPASDANKNLDSAYALRLQFYITYTGNIYTRKMENDPNGEHVFRSWDKLINSISLGSITAVSSKSTDMLVEPSIIELSRTTVHTNTSSYQLTSDGGIKILTEGDYLISGGCYFYDGYAINDMVKILVYKNSIANNNVLMAVYYRMPSDYIPLGLPSKVLHLAANDVIYLCANNSTEARGRVSNNDVNTYMTISRVY